jgi:hypothetical protein
MRHLLPIALLPLLLAQAPAPSPAPSRVTITESPTALDIRIDGKPFTTYRFAPTPDDPKFQRPYFFPVLAADGTEVTSDQMREFAQNPRADHPHQRSIWVGHGDVNGANHWTQSPEQQRHVRFRTVADDTFVEELTWDSAAVDGGAKNPILAEKRVVRILAYPDGTRGLQVFSTLTSHTVDAHFHCKPLNVSGVEAGFLSARLPKAITAGPADQQWITAGGGERPVTGEPAARSTPNAWCDYSGIINNKKYGIALVTAPKNPADEGLPPGLTPFHVRTFGLLANVGPLNWRIEKGDSATFRHLLLIHQGDAAEARVADKAQAWRDTIAKELAR